ncbi:MAG: hypothetical protein DWI48_06230 [Chloroflexi bacterium]|nr:MAG: hypothetical protein DWI48_06230 [Chloroflexota bacterium]
MPLRAVLFDLDGTLADSHELVIVSFLAAFEREGFVVTREAVAAAIGHPIPRHGADGCRRRRCGADRSPWQCIRGALPRA